jgi:hypothetical protein
VLPILLPKPNLFARCARGACLGRSRPGGGGAGGGSFRQTCSWARERRRGTRSSRPCWRAGRVGPGSRRVVAACSPTWRPGNSWFTLMRTAIWRSRCARLHLRGARRDGRGRRGDRSALTIRRAPADGQAWRKTRVITAGSPTRRWTCSR